MLKRRKKPTLINYHLKRQCEERLEKHFEEGYTLLQIAELYRSELISIDGILTAIAKTIQNETTTFEQSEDEPPPAQPKPKKEKAPPPLSKIKLLRANPEPIIQMAAEGLTAKEIAAQLNEKYSRVLNILRELGLDQTFNQELIDNLDKNKEQIIDLIESGLEAKHIAIQFNTKTTTIMKTLKRWNVNYRQIRFEHYLKSKAQKESEKEDTNLLGSDHEQN